MSNLEYLPIELKVLEGTNQVGIVCAETGRTIGLQTKTIVESETDHFTTVTVTFGMRPIKESELSPADIERDEREKRIRSQVINIINKGCR